MIGAGGHASRNIYPNFYFLKNAEVVANADLDEGKARDLARTCGIPRSYTDYGAMLREQKPDGVMVCINKQMHATLAIELMEAGFPVYTEKPNAPDFARSRQVLETGQKTGKLCMVGYKKRFSPSYTKARAIIEGGDFGDPSLLTVVRTKGPSWGSGKDDPQDPYLLDWGCHAVDLLSYLFGPVARVQTFNPHGTTNAWSVNLQFANGAAGNLCLTNRPGPLTEEVAAFGSKGVRIDVSNAINMQARKGSTVLDTNEPEWSCGSRNSSVEQGFLPELQAFVDAIRDGATPASTIETATHTMAVYDAIVKSRETDGAIQQVEAL
jgi:predicted dehydrogenase